MYLDDPASAVHMNECNNLASMLEPLSLHSNMYVVGAHLSFPYIEWARVIQNAERFFQYFFWPQKVGLVFVSGFQFTNKKIEVKQLSKILSVVCTRGKLAIKVKEGLRGTCAYVHYEDQYEAQLAVLLLNGLSFKGYELKVLPCINLFNDKLPDAVFKPVFNLNQHGRFSVKELQALRSFFQIMWSMYMNDKHCRVFECSPVISSVDTCREAVKHIRAHQARKIALDCEGVRLGYGGRLCLIQIATPQMVYIFDVLQGGQQLFIEGGLKDLLEDPTILKIAHDCRKDCIALFREYNVKLVYVYDTQIAYAVLSTQHGGPIPIPVSFSTLLSKYAEGEGLKLKEEVKKEMGLDEHLWEIRPLTKTMTEYAQQDVFNLFLILRNLEPLLSNSARVTVLQRSQEYASIRPRQIHECAAQVNTIPLYNLADWDRILIGQLYGKMCQCTM